MRAIAAALAVFLSLTGCAANSAAPAAGPEPLHAYIQPPIGGAWSGGERFGMYVNRPAYVAVFEVIPGIGTSLVYPAPGFAPRSGLTFGFREFSPADRWSSALYHPASRLVNRSTPRYFFLIASEEPLDLDPLGSYGMRMRSALGVAHFASVSAFSTMERLVELTVPHVAAGNWVTDYYVWWPEVLSDTPRPNYVRMQCGERTLYVRSDRFWAAYETLCRPDRVRPKEILTSGPDGTDEGRPVDPERRPPQPKATDEEDEDRAARIIRERIRSGPDRAAPARRIADEGNEGARRADPGTAGPRSGNREPRSRPAFDRGSSGSADRARPASRPSPGDRAGRTSPVSRPSGGARPSSSGSGSSGSRPAGGGSSDDGR